MPLSRWSLLGLITLSLPLNVAGAALSQDTSPGGIEPAGATPGAPAATQTRNREQQLLEKIRQLKAPRWKSFGNCRYDWGAWRVADGGVRTTTSICGAPEVTGKVAVHCDTLRVSRQNSQGAWGEWRLPLSTEESKSQGGEDLMVANLCANAKPLPATPTPPTAPPATPAKGSSPSPAPSKTP